MLSLTIWSKPTPLMNFKAYNQVRLFLYFTCNLCGLTLCTEVCTVTHNNNNNNNNVIEKVCDIIIMHYACLLYFINIYRLVALKLLCPAETSLWRSRYCLVSCRYANIIPVGACGHAPIGKFWRLHLWRSLCSEGSFT